jgi:plastocyanin
MVITGGLVTILFLPHAYSDFSPNDKYVIKATGYLSGNQTILDSNMALQLTIGPMNGSTIQSTLDTGLVTITHVHYLNSGIWQTPILRDGKYFVIKGDAQDQNGNVIHLNLFGRIISSDQEGSIYTITGKITGSETMKVSFSAEMISNIESTTLSTIPTTQTIPGQQSSSNTVGISIVYHGSDPNNQVHFNPSSIQVAPGTTIIWTNNDVVPHRIESGTASATIGNQSTPVFTPDGKIDSGILAPQQSFQYTITAFNTTSRLSQKIAQIYNIPQSQTLGDITFFDTTYPFMVGVISPLTPTSSSQGSIVQMNIVQGASNQNNVQFLSPSSLRVTSGTTLEFTNNDSVAHELETGQILGAAQGGTRGGTAPVNQPRFTPDQVFDTGVIAPGQQYTIPITKTGTLHIFDPQYTWINGLIVVSSTPTTLAPPVPISISLGSSLPKGTATQQQSNQYNSYYYPDTIQVVPGTPIIWTNNDSIVHTILSGVSTQTNSNPFTPDGKIVSGPIAPGQTYTAIINDTGIIRFYDPQYTWMNGVIISMPHTQSYVIGASTPNLR